MQNSKEEWHEHPGPMGLEVGDPVLYSPEWKAGKIVSIDRDTVVIQDNITGDSVARSITEVMETEQ